MRLWAVTWPEVLRALSEDETRSYAIARVREAGFSGDSFRHDRKAREAVADALTRTEDWIEARRTGSRLAAQRDGIRAIRRAIELEVWP